MSKTSKIVIILVVFGFFYFGDIALTYEHENLHSRIWKSYGVDTEEIRLLYGLTVSGYAKANKTQLNNLSDRDVREVRIFQTMVDVNTYNFYMFYWIFCIVILIILIELDNIREQVGW